MEIRFCDLCNESVPASDLAEGRAYLRRGRVVCARCDAAMSGGADEGGLALAAGAPAGSAMIGGAPAHAASAPPPSHAPLPGHPPQPAHPPHFAHGPHPTGGIERSFGGLGLALGLLALIALVVLSRVFSARLDEAESGQERALASADARWTSDQDAARARIDELERSLHARTLDAERVRGDERALVARELSDARARIDAQARRIDELGQELELARDELRAGRERAQRIEDLARVLDGIGQRGQELAARVDQLSADQASEAPAAAAAPGAEQEAAWKRALPGLRSSDPMERWNSVDELGQWCASGEREALPHLLPMLADADALVRLSTARILGELQALEAVNGLLDALLDPEASVREAAIEALRATTKRDFAYDALADEADRARKVKLFREWWKKAGQEYAGS